MDEPFDTEEPEEANTKQDIPARPFKAYSATKGFTEEEGLIPNMCMNAKRKLDGKPMSDDLISPFEGCTFNTDGKNRL